MEEPAAGSSSSQPAIKKRKATRSKTGPATKVNVDRQCGVSLPDGGVCSRSLTCKTHSMTAKRAIPGRSQPFDVLLAIYQQKNQVKQAHRSAAVARRQEEADEATQGSREAPVSDREEVQLVLRGVKASQCVPLARPRVILSARSRLKYITLREMLFGSLNAIPPLPTMTSTLPSANGLHPNTSLVRVMNSTGSMLGRAIVFNPTTMAEVTRPSRFRTGMMQRR